MLTLANFRIRFPEFNLVPDVRVQMYLDDAVPFTTNPPLKFSIAPSQDIAQGFVAAHWLVTLPQYDLGGNLITFAVGSSAISAKIKVGQIDIEDSSSSGATAGNSDYFKEFNASIYGKRYLEILRTYAQSVNTSTSTTKYVPTKVGSIL